MHTQIGDEATEPARQRSRHIGPLLPVCTCANLDRDKTPERAFGQRVAMHTAPTPFVRSQIIFKYLLTCMTVQCTLPEGIHLEADCLFVAVPAMTTERLGSKRFLNSSGVLFARC